MRQVELLSRFFAAITKDGRISVTHIAIYAAILRFYSLHGSTDRICAYSWQIMELAKISAPTTYHKCVKQLAEYGYIKYEPSFKRTCASSIILVEL